MKKKIFQVHANKNKLISVESGSANLEFMKYAVNYNDHLTALLSANLKQGSPILDFGAGTGEFAVRLVKEGFDVHVLEVEQTLAKDLEEIGFKTATSLTEVSDSFFSFVYSLNVLEHIENDLDALNKISSKLQPNGKLVLYLPAFTILFSEMDRRVGHYRRYSKKSIRPILIEAGYDIEIMHYSDFIGFFAAYLYKLTPRRDGAVSISTIRFFDSFIYPMNRVFDKLFARFCGKNIFIVARKVRD
jgi:SAM-dependent methyltransferase